MSNNFTTEQLKDLEEVFKIFDADESGSIDRDELKSSLTTLEINSSNEEVDAIFDKVDEDNSGVIEWDEFIQLMSTDFYKQYMLKVVRDSIKKHRIEYEIQESGTILEQLGYSVSTDRLIEIAKKVIDSDLSVAEFTKLLQ